MIKIKYVKGDATAPQGKGNKVITHICNDIGGWGAGFVLALSKKWYSPEAVFRASFQIRHNSTLGDIQVSSVEPDITVINMIAQSGTMNHPKDAKVPPIRYEALEKCLKQVDTFCKANNATLHAPRFGAGLAGGDWNKIEKIIESTMSVPVTIYDFN